MTSNKSKELLLEMKNIHIDGFSDERWHKILKGVDLTLYRGEILGLIGESGAGKSTMGKAAMGYTQPGCKIIKGEINFNGIDLAKLTEFEKRKIWGTKISYVAQSAAASFNPAHRLMEQTISAANRLKLNPTDALKKDAVQLYESLQLPDAENIGDRYPHQVSGGQLQRIMTAMAMSPRPELIIFDEPTTALDVTTQVEVLSAMRSIVDKFNTAAIYITHDLAVVAQMADRIKVLRYGEEVEEAEEVEEGKDEVEEQSKSSGIGAGDNKVNKASAGDEEDPGKGKLKEDKEIEESEEVDEDVDLDEVLKALSEEEDEDEKKDEVAELKSDLEEHRSVIETLRGKLNEVNLLNAKLLFTNKLFRKYGLNNEQKMKVVEQFDRASNLREVKLVYSTLGESFNGARKNEINESKGAASKPVASTKPEKEVITESSDLRDRFKKLANL